jgi:hypothetical protein
MLAGRQKEIHAARDRKVEEARQRRQARRMSSQETRLSLGIVNK